MSGPPTSVKEGSGRAGEDRCARGLGFRVVVCAR